MVISKTQVLDDISAGKLTAVSWVIPTNASSDHPSGTDGTGPSWVASVVNAIGTSQYWKDTAIIITWDDWGMITCRRRTFTIPMSTGCECR